MEFEKLKPLFWGNHFVDSALECGPISDELINEAQTKFGIQLPEEYIDLLRIRNGGLLRFNFFPGLDLSIDSMDGICHEMRAHSIIFSEWDSYQVEYEGNKTLYSGTDRLIQLAGDGHGYVCFDYRDSDRNPKISIIETELKGDSVIANNFKEFVEQLYWKPEYHTIVFKTSDVKVLMRELEKIFEVKFESYENFEWGVIANTADDYRAKIRLYKNVDNDGYINLYEYAEYPWYCTFLEHSDQEVTNILAKSDLEYIFAYKAD